MKLFRLPYSCSLRLSFQPQLLYGALTVACISFCERVEYLPQPLVFLLTISSVIQHGNAATRFSDGMMETYLSNDHAGLARLNAPFASFEISHKSES